MDERTAEHLLYLDATLAEIRELAARGRAAYDSDIAVTRACQYDVIRLAADLDRLGEDWLRANPAVPWRLIMGIHAADSASVVWRTGAEPAALPPGNDGVRGEIGHEVRAQRRVSTLILRRDPRLQRPRGVGDAAPAVSSREFGTGPCTWAR